MKTMRAVQREQLTRPFNCQHFHSASLCSVQIDDDDDDDEEALDRRKRKKMCGVEMGKKTNIYSFVPPSLPPSTNSSSSSSPLRFGSFVAVVDIVALRWHSRLSPSSTPFDLHPAHFRQQMGGTLQCLPPARSSVRPSVGEEGLV